LFLSNAAATAFAVQLSFSETQATSQELSAPAQASSQNQSAANATATVAPDQSNNLQVSFQEFQLTFQAVELQAPQQQSADAASSSDSGQNQGLNINA